MPITYQSYKLKTKAINIKCIQKNILLISLLIFIIATQPQQFQKQQQQQQYIVNNQPNTFASQGGNQNQYQNANQNQQQQMPQKNQDNLPIILPQDNIEGSLNSQNQYSSIYFMQIPQISQIPKSNNKQLPEFLILYLFPKKDYQWVNVIMSIYHFDNAQNKFIIQCEKTPTDLIGQCRISLKSITQNQKLIIRIDSIQKQKIQYFFGSQWQTITQIDIDSLTLLDFSQNNQKIQQFHFTIPNQQFTEFRLTLIPKTKQASHDRLKMYGKFGVDVYPTPQNRDFQSIHLWNGGQGIFLSKDQIKFLKPFQRKISLILQAQSQTVYQLQCELIKKNIHQIMVNQILYEHLMPNTQKVYRVVMPKQLSSFKNNKTDYLISILQQAGDLKIQNFKDKQLTKIFQKQPFTYKKDFKILITAEQQQIVQQFYMKVTSGDHDSIFMINFYGRNKQQALKLTQDVSQTLQIYQSQIVYIQYNKYFTSNNANSLINVQILKTWGSLEVQFRICKMGSSLQSCINLKTFEQNSIQMNHYDSTFVGIKSIYKFNISDTNMKFDKTNTRMGYILAHLKNKNQNSYTNPSACIIQFKHNSQMQNLREGKPVTDIIAFGQQRIYKYLNSQPEIVQIRVHLLMVSGDVDFQGFREDPRQIKIDSNSQLDVDKDGNVIIVNIHKNKNPLIFQQNLRQPIYIKIIGRGQSVYGLSIQLKHSNQNQFISTITLEEQIKFKVQIRPQQAEIFLMHSLFGLLLFNYRASGIVTACILNSQNKCQNDLPQIRSQGLLQKKSVHNPQEKIRITNPSINKIVQVQVQFRSAYYNKCEAMKTGQLTHRVINNGQCFEYKLQTINKDLMVYFDRIDMGKIYFKVSVCGTILNFVPQKKTLTFAQDFLQKQCNKLKEGDRTISLTFYSDQKQQKNMKIESLVQFKNQVLTLPDGIAYRAEQTTYQGITGLYYYEFLNLVDTKIYLKQIKGRVSFYVKIFQKDKRFDTSHQIVSKYDYHFKPQSQQWSSDQYLNIKNSQIPEKCNIQSNKCAMNIAVYSKQDIGKTIEYSIEVVQGYKLLKDHELTQDHLLKDSSKYYSYHYAVNKQDDTTKELKNNQEKSTIIIQLSDNNLQCANIYFSQSDMPSENNNIGKSQGNKLIYQVSNKFKNDIAIFKTFYIGVYAKQDCQYKIAVYVTKYDLITLQRGKSSDLVLNQNQVKYYMFQHLSQMSFKIVSLNQYGKLKLYLNKIQVDKQQNGNQNVNNIDQNKISLMNVLKKNQTLKYQNFKITSGESYNTLAVSSKLQGFCSKCHYILAVKAMEKTRGSIMLGDQDTPVSITQRKQYFDDIKEKNTISLLKFIMLKSGKLQIVVYSGEIQFQMGYEQGYNSIKNKQSQRSTLKKVFKKKNQMQQLQFDFIKIPDDIWKPLNVKAKCLTQECAYSLKVRSLQRSAIQDGQIQNTPKLNEHIIQKGHPTFLSIRKGEVQCFTGFGDGKNDQFIISGHRSMVQEMKNLQFQASIGQQKQIKISKIQVRNILVITFKPERQVIGVQKIDLCIKLSEKDKSLVFGGMIQQADELTNVLPVDVEVVVQKQKIFSIYPQGKFILDIFECQGQTQILQGTNEDALNHKEKLSESQKKLQALKNLGMPGQPHAVEMQSFTSTLLKINSPLAVIKWFPINQQKNEGLGYLQYSVGQMFYDTKGQYIIFDFQTLKINQTENENYLKSIHVQQIKYYFYLSNNKNHLKSAVQCTRYKQDDVIVLPLIGEVQSKKGAFNGNDHFSISKSQILTKFSEKDNIYFNVVANLRLKIKQQSKKDKQSKQSQKSLQQQVYQDYRFFYTAQEIPSQVWKNLQKQNLNLILLIAFIVSAVIGLFLFTLTLIKCIIPWISRVRNRNLIEQKNDPKDGSEIIPPSSERNRVNMNQRKVIDDLIVSEGQNKE